MSTPHPTLQEIAELQREIDGKLDRVLALLGAGGASNASSKSPPSSGPPPLDEPPPPSDDDLPPEEVGAAEELDLGPPAAEDESERAKALRAFAALAEDTPKGHLKVYSFDSVEDGVWWGHTRRGGGMWNGWGECKASVDKPNWTATPEAAMSAAFDRFIEALELDYAAVIEQATG